MAAYTTIDDPEKYFQVKLTTGTGSSQAVTFDGDTDMQPDLIWGKRRDSTGHPTIFDSVRGITKGLETNGVGAEFTSTDYYTAFGSDGFTIAAGSSGAGNGSSETAVQWCWKETADAGFDIVSYTGNNTAGATVSHNLSQIPDLMIFKNRDDDDTSWCVYHSAHGTTGTGRLDLTNAFSDTSFITTTPSSSVFTLTATTIVNGSSHNIIAYCFASKQGFSKFGKYTGNSSTDGTFVHLGFRPAFVMIKNITSAQQWFIIDNKRSTHNPSHYALLPNDNAAEYTNQATNYSIDILSNGFKLKTSGNTSSNANNATGNDYIYIAFAEQPFVNSNGVPNNAR